MAHSVTSTPVTVHELVITPDDGGITADSIYEAVGEMTADALLLGVYTQPEDNVLFLTFIEVEESGSN